MPGTRRTGGRSVLRSPSSAGALLRRIDAPLAVLRCGPCKPSEPWPISVSVGFSRGENGWMRSRNPPRRILWPITCRRGSTSTRLNWTTPSKRLRIGRIKNSHDVLREAHFRQCEQECQRRFRSLVLVHTVHVQRVAAAAGGFRVEFQAKIVPAEEPVESALSPFVPPNKFARVPPRG